MIQDIANSIWLGETGFPMTLKRQASMRNARRLSVSVVFSFDATFKLRHSSELVIKYRYHKVYICIIMLKEPRYVMIGDNCHYLYWLLGHFDNIFNYCVYISNYDKVRRLVGTNCGLI